MTEQEREQKYGSLRDPLIAHVHSVRHVRTELVDRTLTCSLHSVRPSKYVLKRIVFVGVVPNDPLVREWMIRLTPNGETCFTSLPQSKESA